MKEILSVFICLVTCTGIAQESEFLIREVKIDTLLSGSLYTFEKAEGKNNLIILIAGSGPTDRNGNQPGAKNNALKFMAKGLANSRYDVFSFDKRIFALAKSGELDESKLRFDNFIGDVKNIIKYFRSNYDKIILVGHSEGSLIGMIAANENADAFISISGAGRRIDRIMEEQIATNYPLLDTTKTREYFSLLKEGETFKLDNPAYMAFFRESVQPYMISWIQYDPSEEIKKLNIPILIVNGNQDLQVKEAEAQLLKEAQPNAELIIIENMNHVLKEVKGGKAENLASYSNPDLPVAPELIKAIKNFLNILYN